MARIKASAFYNIPPSLYLQTGSVPSLQVLAGDTILVRTAANNPERLARPPVERLLLQETLPLKLTKFLLATYSERMEHGL